MWPWSAAAIPPSKKRCICPTSPDHVTVVHRRDKFRAEAILIDRLTEKSRTGNVKLEWNHTLDEVLGDKNGVTGMRIRSHQKRQRAESAAVRRVHRHRPPPNTQIFQGQLDMVDGYIVTKSGNQGGATATSVPGVFAAGDVQDHVYRQAVTSAGTGCMAALDAEKYLEELGHRCFHRKDAKCAKKCRENRMATTRNVWHPTPVAHT